MIRCWSRRPCLSTRHAPWGWGAREKAQKKRQQEIESERETEGEGKNKQKTTALFASVWSELWSLELRWDQEKRRIKGQLQRPRSHDHPAGCPTCLLFLTGATADPSVWSWYKTRKRHGRQVLAPRKTKRMDRCLMHLCTVASPENLLQQCTSTTHTHKHPHTHTKLKTSVLPTARLVSGLTSVIFNRPFCCRCESK